MDAWQALLPPDDPHRDYILDGVKNGFRVTTQDYTGDFVCERNYKSATNPKVAPLVEQQIKEEIANGRYIITKDRPRIISALGAIMKDNGKVRLIHDCSRPPGNALNDLAECNRFSYQSIQDAVNLITPGCYMAKVDLASAYRSVKIHPQDFTLSGLAWTFEGDTSPTIMHDSRLMFGARLSPGIFHQLTQAVRRMMAHKGFDSNVAYLDDILLINQTKEECYAQTKELMSLLRSLGFAINYNKVVCPTQLITFLGVELNSLDCTLGLPSDKMEAFMKEVHCFYGKKSVSKRELQSLAGKLSWCSQVIHGGRPHLRRILDKIKLLNGPSHRTRVTSDVRKDLAWWIDFAPYFNGTLPMLDTRPYAPLCIDACPKGGGGYFMGDGFNIQWSNWPGTLDLPINYLEVLPLETAARLWGPLWGNKIIKVHIDNKAACAIINKGTCKHPFVMDSLRRVFWLSAYYNFKISAVYYPGESNVIADALSRVHEPAAWNVIRKIFPHLFNSC